MRVLMLATYFPKPNNPAMGVWALREADQLRDAGAEIRVVSLTSWVPRLLGRLGVARAWAGCPLLHQWGMLGVEYPRWPFYQAGPLKKLWHRWPHVPLAFAWPFAAPYLRRFIQQWRPDVIFAHHGAVNGYLAVRLHREFGIPFVVKDYDFAEIEDCRRFPGRFKVYRRVTHHAATMVAAANRMKDEMLAQFPDAHVVVHHNGADPIPREIQTKPRPKELDGKVVICSTGIFYSRKGFPLLARAFARVAKKHPNVVLRICGDGAERPAVESAIRDCGIADRVTLLGLQPHQTVLQEMVWSDIFALVGWDEPFATVYLEALSAGKPIVCASDGGINDVLQSEVHGLVVPPRDEESAAAAIERLVVDQTFRQRCSENAKILFESQLSSTVATQKLLSILADALKRKPA